MKQTTINGKEILLVEVPEGCHLVEITFSCDKLVFWEDCMSADLELPPGSYQFLFADPVKPTEAECKGVVEKIRVEYAPSPSNDMAGDWVYAFTDYENPGDFAGWLGDAGAHRTALNSWHSFLRSEGFREGRVVALTLKK